MPAVFPPTRLVLASHNAGKIAECRALLAPLRIELCTAADYNLIEPAETGTDFYANALIKAQATAHATGLWALADDSGICVSALNDAPGVYTADWAGYPRDWGVAMQRVHDELGDNPDRRAYFVSVLCLVSPFINYSGTRVPAAAVAAGNIDSPATAGAAERSAEQSLNNSVTAAAAPRGAEQHNNMPEQLKKNSAEPLYYKGEAHGTLIWPPRGDMGFGFDPMFVPDGYAQTYAEMPGAVKNRISHRAQAMDQLLAALRAAV